MFRRRLFDAFDRPVSWSTQPNVCEGGLGASCVVCDTRAVWKVDMCSRESACLKIWPCKYAIRDEIIRWDGESNLGAYS